MYIYTYDHQLKCWFYNDKTKINEMLLMNALYIKNNPYMFFLFKKETTNI